MTRARLINARPSLPGKSNAIAGHTMRCRPFARPARAAAYSPGTSSDASAGQSITSSLHFREACSFLIESAPSNISRESPGHMRPFIRDARLPSPMPPTDVLSHRRQRSPERRDGIEPPGLDASGQRPTREVRRRGAPPPPHRLARRGQDTGRAMWRIDPNCARRGPASRYPIRR